MHNPMLPIPRHIVTPKSYSMPSYSTEPTALVHVMLVLALALLVLVLLLVQVMMVLLLLLLVLVEVMVLLVVMVVVVVVRGANESHDTVLIHNTATKEERDTTDAETMI